MTATFLDNGAVLLNPGMGFTHYEYDNQPEIYGSRLDYSDTISEFPGLSTVYLRLAWGHLEPQEGQYDWSWFDGPAQRWIAKGKRVCLRITTSESFNRYATPKWVFDAGAREVPFLEKYSERYLGGRSFEPDFSDPIYLEKLDRFFAAAAARYDGDPNIEFVDIGTFGMWGEAHTWHGSNTRYAYDTLLKHIDLHTRHFKKTRLIINDSHLDQDWGSPELMQICLSHRMGIRNDSICCLGRIPFRDITLHTMRAFWMTAPTVVETGHYGSCMDVEKTWNSDFVLRAVQELHASYCSIHWWPREFLEAEHSLIDEINRILGYRLQLKEASWPDIIRHGEPWQFTARWANAGVAPLYEDVYPSLTFKAANGGIAAVRVDESMNLRRVLPECVGKSSPGRYLQESTFLQAAPVRRVVFSQPDPERELPHAFKLTLDDLKMFGERSSTLRPGIYDLYLSVGSRIGTPRIALPLDGDDGQRRYRLGSITLAKEA